MHRLDRRLDRLMRRARGLLRRRRPVPVILMYHRVAEPAVDPWGLAVSPRCFDAQMEVLADRPHADGHAGLSPCVA